MVPQFPTGRPMQSQKILKNKSLFTGSFRKKPAQYKGLQFEAHLFDRISCLADVIMGTNSKPSSQTLTVRPVSTTKLMFDGESEKFDLFEDLFHTMIEVQPDMTETVKRHHFQSLLRKNALQSFRNINSAIRQTLDDVLAVFRVLKSESHGTAKHK